MGLQETIVKPVTIILQNLKTDLLDVLNKFTF